MFDLYLSSTNCEVDDEIVKMDMPRLFTFAYPKKNIINFIKNRKEFRKDIMDLYFAGAEMPPVMEECKKLEVAKLFTNATERKFIKDFANKENFNGKLLVDSGAFTTHTQGKEMNIDDYINFVNENDEGIDWFIEVDHIPGVWGQPQTIEQLMEAPIKSWDNYLYMIERLKSPKKCLPVFHQGEDFKYLARMLEFKYNDGTPIVYICISGNKQLASKDREIWYKKCFEIIEKSTNPKVKIHCLGNQTLHQLERFPFTSSDATSWIRGAAFGSIMTKWGNVLVSGVQKNDMEHVINMNQIGKQTLENYVKKFGFELTDLIEDKEKGSARINRIIFNLRYLKDWADHYEYKGPKSFITNKLF